MVNISDIYFFYVGKCEPNFATECRIAYWLWRTVPFVLLFVGTVGNTLSIIVLSRSTLRKYTTSILLLFLAISDTVMLWTILMPETLYSITKFRFMDHNEVCCRLQYWLFQTFGGFSVWLLVLLTVERTIITKAHAYSRTKLTSKKALVVCVLTLCFIALINSHLIYGLTIHHTVTGINGSTIVVKPYPDLPCDYVDSDYRKFIEGPWALCAFLLYMVLPAVIILLGNIFIGVTLFMQRKKLSKVNPEIAKYRQESERTSDRTKSATKMLFVLSTVFILTTLPYGIYFVKRGTVTEIHEDYVPKWQLATVTVNILMWFNFTFNFFLYIVKGQLFKQEWSRLIDKCKRMFENTWSLR